MRAIKLAAALAIAAIPAAAQQPQSMDNSVYKIQEREAQSSPLHKQPTVSRQEKLRRALEAAGFRQITIIDAAYVVRAKTEDGEEVVMHVEAPALAQQRTGARKPDESFDTDSIYTADEDIDGDSNDDER